MKTYQVTSKKRRIDYKGNETVKIKRSILTTSTPQKAKKIVKTWNKGTAWYITEVEPLTI